MMIFYPKFGSYTPMFSIPDKIDEFRVIYFIFSTFAKSFSVVYCCFHCESVWLTNSVYGSDLPNDADIIKYLLVLIFNKCSMKWNAFVLSILPLCCPIFRHSQLGNRSQRRYFWKHIQLQFARSCKLRAAVTCETFIATFRNISC